MFDHLTQHHIYRGGELPPLTAIAYDYILAGNGLFKRAKNSRLFACMPVANLAVAGLPHLQPRLTLTPGRKVPGRLLRAIFTDARRYAQRGQEQMYYLRWNESGLRATRPPQQAGGARVAYRVEDEAGIVCELHSHHTMRAYFSATDDNDEQGFRLYAVIGNLLEQPEIALRLGMYGDFFELPAKTLFDELGPFADCYSRSGERPVSRSFSKLRARATAD